MEMSTVLQKVDLQIYDNFDCAQIPYPEDIDLKIHPNNICAGVEGGGKGQCNGDSGWVNL